MKQLGPHARRLYRADRDIGNIEIRGLAERASPGSRSRSRRARKSHESAAARRSLTFPAMVPEEYGCKLFRDRD